MFKKKKRLTGVDLPMRVKRKLRSQIYMYIYLSRCGMVRLVLPSITSKAISNKHLPKINSPSSIYTVTSPYRWKLLKETSNNEKSISQLLVISIIKDLLSFLSRILFLQFSVGFFNYSYSYNHLSKRLSAMSCKILTK